ncbi:MAG: hypothetical protein GXO33_02365 [Epsilonproteobacteria bacterium]|nr:hypothetical protein [Campylobacterota bacterium]
MRPYKVLIALLTGVLLFAGCSNKVEEKPVVKIEKGNIAPAIVVGKPFPKETLTDQFGKKGGVTDDTKKVILVFGKATGHLVKEFLNTKPADYLAVKHTVFIADVSGMPSLILKYVALPDLQKHRYPIYLITDKGASKSYKNDRYADFIMVVDLDDNGIVEKAEFVTTAKDLEKAID